MPKVAILRPPRRGIDLSAAHYTSRVSVAPRRALQPQPCQVAQEYRDIIDFQTLKEAASLVDITLYYHEKNYLNRELQPLLSEPTTWL
jgi:hypothetical protein